MSRAVSQHAHATFSCARSARWQNLDEKVRHPRWGFLIPLPMVAKSRTSGSPGLQEFTSDF